MNDQNSSSESLPPSATVDEAVAWLRPRDIDTRVSWLSEQFQRNAYAACYIGKRVGLSANHAVRIVEQSIENADASSIRWWLEFVCDVAGVRAMFRLLETWEAGGHHLRVKNAAYWMPRLDAMNSEMNARAYREHVRRHDDR